jgi:centromeric protein E
MSPAHCHIEQSRNTLLFANCAKDVVTDAQVNVVMSDKALLKHLQRELARLENELKFPGSASCSNHAEALREKDELIKQVPFTFIYAVMTTVELDDHILCAFN